MSRFSTDNSKVENQLAKCNKVCYKREIHNNRKEICNGSSCVQWKRTGAVLKWCTALVVFSYCMPVLYPDSPSGFETNYIYA